MPPAAPPLLTGERWLHGGAVVTPGPLADVYHTTFMHPPAGKGVLAEQSPSCVVLLMCLWKWGLARETLLLDDAQSCGLPPIASLPGSQSGLYGASRDGETMAWWPRWGRYWLVMGKCKEGASCMSCVHRITLSIYVSCGLKFTWGYHNVCFLYLICPAVVVWPWLLLKSLLTQL